MSSDAFEFRDGPKDHWQLCTQQEASRLQQLGFETRECPYEKKLPVTFTLPPVPPSRNLMADLLDVLAESAQELEAVQKVRKDSRIAALLYKIDRLTELAKKCF